MKTKFISAFLILILASCNTGLKKENEALKEQTTKLLQENDAYKTKTKKQAASIEAYRKTLREIDDNLKSVDINSTLVAKLDGEVSKTSQKDIINARIASIKALIDNSKLKILALDRTLNELRKKYGDQSDLVLELNRAIKEQTQIILEKEIELQASLADIEDLQIAYDQQVQYTEQLREIINRAWIYAGSSKELKNKEIVDMEGGFIGIGRVKVLNSNTDDKFFNQIKKDETDSLIFTSKSIKLITEHPEGSFEIKSKKDKSSLYVTNKKEFWKSGNYLIVQTN